MPRQPQSRPRVPDAVKRYAVQQVQLGHLTVKEAAATGIGLRQLYTELKAVEETGDITSRGKSSGTKLKAPPAVHEYVLALFRHKPSLYLDEAAALVLHHFDIQVHKCTISRWLKKAGVTHKKLAKYERRRDEEARLHYSLVMGQFRTEQLVFADETHFDDRNFNRKNGWAEVGERAAEAQSSSRAGGISVLPAMDHNGLFAVWSVEGAVDGEKFRYWVQEFLLPQMNAYPGPRSILIIDNCRTHLSPEVREMVEERGCVLQYLPKYSPDYNPIESAFSAIKTAVQSAETRKRSDIHHACCTTVNPQHARNFFRNCGYV